MLIYTAQNCGISCYYNIHLLFPVLRIGLISKVIPLKLLDMVLSYFEDATPAMRGQPTRLSRNYQRRNGGKFGEKSFYVLIFERCFIAEMFSTLSAVVLNCVHLVGYYFAVYSVLGSF